MRVLTTTAISFVIVGITTFTVAAEPDDATQEVTTMPSTLRAQIDRHLIGEWTWKATWGERALKGELMIRWTDGNTGVLMEGFSVADGEKTMEVNLLGWDGTRNALVGRGFGTDGGTGRTRWTEFTDTKWTGRGSGNYKGKPWKSDTTFEFMKDRMRYEDVTHGEPFVVVYSRKPKPGPDYAQLKAMSWVIGDWEAEWVIPSEGFPLLEGYSPGAKVRSTNSYFWMENQNYIGFKFRDTCNGELLHQGYEIIGVDPTSRKLVHWIFSILGGSGFGKWSQDGNTWVLKWSGSNADGSHYEGVSYVVPVDANTFTWQMKNAKHNGEKLPDTPEITFRRVSKEKR
jgi:hypothetical protein